MFTRDNCCDLSQVQIPRIMSQLTLAFVLCREIPNIFQKVKHFFRVFFYIIFLLFFIIDFFSHLSIIQEKCGTFDVVSFFKLNRNPNLFWLSFGLIKGIMMSCELDIIAII